MSMVKVIAPGSYDWGEVQAQMVKIAAGGLRGNDLRAFVKRAGHEFADILQRVKLASGEVPIHLLAMGATEYYGPNRNGDGFRADVCEARHHTFVKHARWYRNHANKNPDKSWGIVKHSHYNPHMHRIELLVALNGTKEAAARNGGMVATEELEKLANGEDLAVSMACRVPFDVCSGCGNKARNKEEYCTGIDQGGHCKMGGLRDRITLVSDSGDQLYADNPDPTFFDISRVFRPADRIAWVTGQLKAASHAFVSGVDLASEWQVTAPSHLSDDPRVARWAKLASHLASIEQKIRTEGGTYSGLAWVSSVQPELPWHDHGVKTAEAVAALQLARVCPPIEGYLALGGLGGPATAELVKQAKHYLPGIYGRMLDDGTLASVDLDAYAGAQGVPSLRARAWAEKRASDFGLGSDHVRRRTLRASLQGDGVPQAREAARVKIAGAAYDVARNYALFKLALLDRLPRSSETDGAYEAAVAQHYV